VPGTKGEDTKEAIRRRAMVDFRHQGYEATTLSEIGGHLGISRAAVLHHYGSKLRLLHAVVDPYLEAIAELIARYEAIGMSTLDDRRSLIAEYLDICLANPEVAGIMSWDITSRNEPTFDVQATRFWALQTGRDATLSQRLVAAAVAAVVVRPLTDPSIDPHDPQIRRILLIVANAVIDLLGIDAVNGLGRTGTSEREAHSP
jgi:AcrR family transcriptional regulator